MNNYAKITMGSDIVPLRFSQYAISQFTQAVALNRDYYYAGNAPTTLGIAKLLHLGYRNQCAISENKPVLSLEQFLLWIESAEMDTSLQQELKGALEAFARSPYLNLVADKPKETAKKPRKAKAKPEIQ